MDPLRIEQLQLATRNHGMPREAMRYPVTPVGLHYVLVHCDIPAVDPAARRADPRRTAGPSADARPR